ncbi:MAG TPA: tetratricopeptide repeat protein [Chthoniobacterales bacterium]|nr:tetratricopeptide repeat protein [Chthoniobacterales bacterium]
MRAQFLFRFALCVALVAITWMVFGQTLGHGFVNFDDPVYVSENPQIQAGLNWQNIRWAFTHIHSHNWHPLATMSHMLDWQLFGAKPGAHHFVNVLLQSASAVLLFLLLQQLTGNFLSSAFVAAIFAIHPLHVESVAWIAERKDVLSGFFFMLTLLAYVYYTRKPNLTRYLAIPILFGCGLLSKPMLVTLPIILLLLDYWPLNRNQKSEVTGQKSFTSSKLIFEKIPLFILSAGSVTATLIAQHGGIVQIAQLPLSWRGANALSAYLFYIWQTIWPANLALIYPHPGQLPLWQTICAGAVLILITASTFVLRRRRPYLIIGWLWYLIMLLPVIGLIQVGSQAHADRYSYLPQIGLWIAATWGIVDLSRSFRWRREVFSVAAPVIVAVFAWRAWVQTSYWQNTERLWSHTFAVTKQNDIAHFNMGEFLLKAKRFDEAIAQFQIFLAGHPSDPAANFQIGSAFMEKGELDPAIRHFQTTLKVEPDNPEAETNLANVLLKAERLDEALEHYRSVVRHEPRSALAHYNLAVGLHRQGRLSEAIVHYREALAIQPGYPDADYFLGEALLQNGQPDEARPHLEKR